MSRQFVLPSVSAALLERKNRGSRSNVTSTDELLPVLIIPGIMSSGLEVRKSAVHDKHIGERVWLNPIALARGKLGFGKAFTTAEGIDDNDAGSSNNKSPERRNNKPLLEEGDSDFFEKDMENSESEEEEEDGRELDCKSPWLQHMTLTSDGCTEREGNEIRPIPGLDGVDFLTDIASINVGASYVFGPVIKLLVGIGYEKGLNLDACPYDWRIPPLVLEERDKYFTKTVDRIEKMWKDNGGKSVVLLCHSMGAKTGHYMLNFVVERLGASEGRQWIDKHIHTYMPLGATHIGVPATVATAFSGVLNPILDPMLSLQDRLVFSRSMGSGVWLMPKTLPCIERNAIPVVFCKREGKLTVTILATKDNPIGDLRTLVNNKYGTREVSNIKIKVSYGDKKTNSGRSKILSGKGIPVAPPHIDGNMNSDAQYVALPCPKFIFPTPESLLEGDESLKPIRFYICERGDIRAHHLEPRSKAIRMLQKVDLRGHQSAMLWNKAAKKAGKYKTNLGMSSPIDNIDIRNLVAAGEKGLTIDVPIVARTDIALRRLIPKENHRSISIKVNIKWEPPPSNKDDDFTNPIAMIPGKSSALKSSEGLFSPLSFFASIPEIKSTREECDDSNYVPLSGQALLMAEGLENSYVAVARDKYNPQKDRVDPRGKSSYNRPPVKRVYAIYGINLDTPVSAVCKRVSCYHEDETPHELLARPRFEIDTETRLEDITDEGENKCARDEETKVSSSSSSSRSGHKLRDGILYEHPGTPQIDLLKGKIISKSGDGSVPYYCLQQSQVWANELGNSARARETGDKIKIEELEGAEHRAILSDERFHSLLVNYVTGATIL